MKNLLFAILAITCVSCSSAEIKKGSSDNLVTIMGQSKLAVYDPDEKSIEFEKNVEPIDVIAVLVNEALSTNSKLLECEKKNAPKEVKPKEVKKVKKK